MKKYYTSVNLLRAFAVVSICFYHFTNTPVNGESFLGEGDLLAGLAKLGVNTVFMFFVISGFVIPMSMKNGGYTLRSFPRFIARRMTRLQIPYVASILGGLLFYYISCRIYMWNFEVDPWQFFHHLIYTVEFTDYEWYNVVFWTLAIEFQYYILIALLFPLLLSKHKLVKLGTLFAFACSSLLIGDHGLLFYYAPIFSLGIALFLMKDESISKIEALLIMLLMTALIFYVHTWGIASVALFATLFIAFIHVDWKVFNSLGEVSYSLYLVHGVVGGNLIFWFAEYIDNYAYKVAFVFGILLLSIVSSYVFAWMFEKPAQRISRKIKV
ncbi:MAG: acyltransferase [Crocinitomicaceae bacterium]|nr:acyltransferase [Crocinitomicaceae bacterium]